MTDLHMTELPGYTGKLNAQILERVRFLSKELQIPDLESKFPHLHVSDGSWRKPLSLPANDAEVDLSDYIDHTLLKAESTREAILHLCDEARQHHLHCVCVNGTRVKLCVDDLSGSGVKVGSTCGFPLGANTTAVKVAEAAAAVADGAADVDVVLNIGAALDGDWRYILRDLRAVRAACPPPVVLKVIMESAALPAGCLIDAAIVAIAAGADFVKTSTGFHPAGGARPADVDVMLAVAGNSARVKASGGVRDRQTALQYVRAGVARIGTSNGVEIVTRK
ncbi:deoxyribose-phosphate aldolase [Trypanosoma theileri]|uniref:deoxyribose-phosphate aldolase n=1 Tax=Trypanosoma theileri TaxID=67003 RepID=A0A1X0NLL0_9TRYP|nr:deoxyribose-phosphate aldolase [Trypanosoma theileri]ORC85343.1 deoxyribose-phosphate aldolase [Trypanosoma theileri]